MVLPFLRAQQGNRKGTFAKKKRGRVEKLGSEGKTKGEIVIRTVSETARART
jgi:hypothetical protein